jgi:hypothetical protein
MIALLLHIGIGKERLDFGGVSKEVGVELFAELDAILFDDLKALFQQFNIE